MVSHLLESCTILLSVFFGCAFSDIPHKKFEYKFSFKGPYLGQKDGSVPFWTYGGSAIASEESVRVTPSLRSKKGFIWTKNITNFDWWEVEMVFRVVGRGRIGADGLAFWYTEEQGVEGPVFGSNDRWKGLGIFFDSFDNDNKHNNPYIMGMINDGQMLYDHQNDGLNQQLAGCLRDYRNKPFAVRAKVEYYRNTLSLLIHNGMTDSDQDYEICFRVDNVVLPQRGYFGLSAATGGLADDHDILKFLTSSLLPPEEYRQMITQPGMSDSEKERLAREFEDYRNKLQQQKEEFQKQHPDQVKEQSDEDWYEPQQELRQIFNGQSRMYELQRDLHRKMDEIIGRQERTLSLLSAIQPGGVVPSAPAGGHGAVPMADTIRRHEVDAVLNNQRDIVNTAREIKSYVAEIHKRAAQPAGATGTAYDLQNLANEMRDGLNVVKRDLSTMASKSANVPPCPSEPTTPCLSTTVFLTFTAIQLILTVGYLVYRDTKESQAKKFY